MDVVFALDCWRWKALMNVIGFTSLAIYYVTSRVQIVSVDKYEL